MIEYEITRKEISKRQGKHKLHLTQSLKFALRIAPINQVKEICDRTDTISEQEILTGAEGFVEKRFAQRTPGKRMIQERRGSSSHTNAMCVRELL